jgi:large subunit ribosomal protein L30
MSELNIQLIKSLSGRLPKHVKIAHALGLRKIRQSVEKSDTPVIRGMIDKISYLIKISKNKG